jgi:hypothetical protein
MHQNPESQNNQEDNPYEKHIEFDFGPADVVLIGSRRKGYAREDSDYDFVVCPQHGPIPCSVKLWSDVSVEIMKQIGWHEGLQKINSQITESFSLPERTQTDIFILITRNNVVSAARLEWDDHHQALGGWAEQEYFDEVKPLIEKYIQ